MKNPIYMVYLREEYVEDTPLLWAVFTSKKKAHEQLRYIATDYIPHNYKCENWWEDGTGTHDKAIIRCDYSRRGQRVFRVWIEEKNVSHQIVK